MSQGTIDRLIINSPYDEPQRYWSYQRETRSFSLQSGRRPAGYVVASPNAQAFDDPGIFVEIPLVNQIRLRVKQWRQAAYPGVTTITRRLLEHWNDPELFETRRFFFCQLEAIETLIWLTEAPPAARVGVRIPSDGGEFERICTKLATGGGKTIVMAMLIAWQVLNKIVYSHRTEFSKNVLVIAPGLTVRNRLAVLDPNSQGNYFETFAIVPTSMLEQLRRGRVLIRNWHALTWETDEELVMRRSVDKRGAKSNEAYVREVLEELASARNLLVINDEAHHAWRMPPGKSRGVSKSEIEEATKWIGGLDRVHRARGILKCHDFSATPFIPSGHQAAGEALFDWIVSDFGLNDAIESGLVKTPRVVVRDDAVPDARTYKSRLYHIYSDSEVRDDLNRRAEPQEPLPDLLVNAYYLLGYDWRETAKAWAANGLKTPPVMITVANRTETAARVKYAFDRKRIQIPELCDAERILHIDSRVLEEAEGAEEPIGSVPIVFEASDESEEVAIPRLTKKQQAERLRQLVDTVGQPGKQGELIQNVISVGMLSEGWDAKTVTHIMGLRAFTSQLLCEQVVGRGLRRTSYELNSETGLFDPEYVNVFGVPFSFLPHEGEAGTVRPTPPKTRIEALLERRRFEIRWPNVVRLDHIYRPRLTLDWSKVALLEFSASQTIRLAEIAPVVDGKPDVAKIAAIELEKLARECRMQRIVFEAARDVFAQMEQNWRGSREYLLTQLVHLVEQFVVSDRIKITPALYDQDDLKRRLLITLNMTRVIQHIWEAIRFENTAELEPVFDAAKPIRSTGDMTPWYSSRPCEFTRKSHVNFCVVDSTWESSEAFQIERHPSVDAWAKNDHLGFEMFYVFRGVVRKYRPDFLIRLTTGENLVLETKGKDTDQDKTKRRFLDEWVRAINENGGFGRWAWGVSHSPSDLPDILEKHAKMQVGSAVGDARMATQA